MSETSTTRAYVDIWPDHWTVASQAMRNPRRYYVEVIGHRETRYGRVAKVKLCFDRPKVFEVDAEDVEIEYVP